MEAWTSSTRVSQQNEKKKKIWRLCDSHTAFPPGVSLPLNTHNKVPEWPCRRLVFGASGQVAMADVLPRLWAILVGLGGFQKTLPVLLEPAGLDAGQLIEYLCLIVLTRVWRQGGMDAVVCMENDTLVDYSQCLHLVCFTCRKWWMWQMCEGRFSLQILWTRRKPANLNTQPKLENVCFILFSLLTNYMIVLSFQLL